MSARRMMLALTAAMVLAVGLMATAVADVEPTSHNAELAAGESTTVTKTVTVPEFPSKLDLVLDVDLSGSYADDITTIKNKKSDIFNGVRSEVADSRFGLISFVDYPFSPWGAENDYPYRRNQDLTTDQATWESAVDAMSTEFGSDEPESQLESLRQAATGVGQDLNDDGDFDDLGEIASGQDPSFRADATKVIAITTDASMHTEGDSDCDSPSPPCPFPYPGPTMADTVAALNDANIKVVAIKAPGSTSQMDELANNTDGAITSTDASSSEIVEAIVSSLEQLSFDVTGNPVDCDPLDVSFDPAVHTDVAGGSTVEFEETVTVPAGTAPGEYPCTVEFRADDTVIGSQEVTITVPGADLVVDKSVADDEVELGESTSFTVTVANNGPQTATAVTAVDTLPDGVELDEATPSSGDCTVDGTTVTCELGDLAAGATATIELAVTGTEAGEQTNAVQASSSRPDPDPEAASAEATVSVVAPVGPQQADLVVDQSVADDEVELGESTSFTVTVANNGPETATAVTAVDTLPDGVELDEATPSSGDCTVDGATVTCELGGLAAGATATIELAVTGTEAGEQTNAVEASSSTPDPDAATAEATVTVVDGSEVVRLGGADRIETAIEVSQDSYPDGGVDTVVLARSTLFADALAGTPLAVDRDAPLLLTPPWELDGRTEAEIQRLMPEGGTVVLLGGEAALEPQVASALTGLGYDTERIGGAHRFETARLIAEQGLGSPDTVFMATGMVPSDALTSGAVAGIVDGAVLLTADEDIPPDTQAYLDANPDVTRYAVGGPASDADPDADDRFVGPTRFETALEVAEAFVPEPEVVGVATAFDFPDSLTGGAHVSRQGGPVVLSDAEPLHGATEEYLADHADSLTLAYLYGGTAALSGEVEDEAGAAIGGP